jgi:hypothetical protein
MVVSLGPYSLTARVWHFRDPLPSSILITEVENLNLCHHLYDRLCGLVVRVLGYRFGGSGSIPGTTRFSEKKKKKKKKKGTRVVGLERGPLSLVSTN